MYGSTHMLAFVLIGIAALCSCSRDEEPRNAGPSSARTHSTEERAAFLSQMAADIAQKRKAATQDQPPNTKNFSEADGLAMHAWVRDAGAEIRSRLAIEICARPDTAERLNTSLTDIAAFLLEPLARDHREDLVVQLLASDIPTARGCPTVVVLQGWYCEGVAEAGLELLLDAHTKASPQRQKAIETEIRSALNAYLPRTREVVRGDDLIAWTRNWYRMRKNRTLPNYEYCSAGDTAYWFEPMLLDAGLVLERRIAQQATAISDGKWRPARFVARESMPSCVPKEAIAFDPGPFPISEVPELESALAQDGTIVRLVDVRSVERCDKDWLLIDVFYEVASRNRSATGGGSARFVMHERNKYWNLMLPEAQDK